MTWIHVSVLITLFLSFSENFTFGFRQKMIPRNRFLSYQVSNRFIPDSLKARLHKGTVSPHEIDRIFKPNRFESDKISRTLASGFAGVIISLEGCMVNLKSLYGYTLAIFAAEINQPVPTPTDVYDLVGGSFKDITIGLGWNIKDESMKVYEDIFYKIMMKLMDKVSIAPSVGITRLVNDIIKDGNEIIVKSSLPRPVVLKILGVSGLSKLFEGRVSPENLICDENEIDDLQERYSIYGDKYQKRKFVQSCAILMKPTFHTVLIDSNRHNIMAAKRTGLSCVAIRGYAKNAQYLRSADLIVDSLDKVSIHEIYKIVKTAIKQEEGPQQQTDSASARQETSRLSTIAPAEAQRRPKAETVENDYEESDNDLY